MVSNQKRNVKVRPNSQTDHLKASGDTRLPWVPGVPSASVKRHGASRMVSDVPLLGDSAILLASEHEK